MQPQLYYNYIVPLALNVLQHQSSKQNRLDLLHILKVVCTHSLYISGHVVGTFLSIFMKILIVFIVNI